MSTEVVIPGLSDHFAITAKIVLFTNYGKPEKTSTTTSIHLI